MALREKLLYAIGIEVDGAKKGLKDFRKAVLEADTTTGKFKAGASSAFDTVKQNAALFAAGAGAAIAAWGIKSVTAFTDTAKAAVDGAAATGINTEAMSRWIAVGDDFQVSADQLVTGIGKIGKTLDSGKWEKYGIATRDASGNARDANDILLDSLSALSGITNETERAKAGNELFGKGYANLAPLIGHTRDEYENMLGAVEKGQVITAKEAAKAEKTRLAYDKLHDTIDELSSSLGQTLAPAAADAASGIAAVVAGAQDLAGAINDIPGIGSSGEHTLTDALIGKGGLPGELGLIKDAAQAVGERFGIVDEKATDAANAFDLVSDSSDRNKGALALQKAEQNALNAETDKGNSAFSVYFDNIENATKATERKAAEDEKAADAAKKHRDAVEAVADAMDKQRSAALKLVGGDIAVAEAQREAAEAADDETLSLDQKRQAQYDAAQAVADYKATQMEANGETVDAQVQAQLLKGALQDLSAHLSGPLADAIQSDISYLDELTKPRTATVNYVSNLPGRVGDINSFSRVNAPRAGGGPTYPGLHPVIENGPELLQQDGKTYLMSNGGGNVVPMSNGGVGMSGGTYTINVYSSGDVTPERIVDAIKKFERSNGAGWRS